MKGLDILIKAFAPLKEFNWELTIIGEGPEYHKINSMAFEFKIRDKINFMGSKTNKEVRKLMAKFNYLTLPSRYDGWGAVVNEALLSGTPVLISDRCGASDLIRKEWLGKIFQNSNINQLTSLIREAIELGPLSVEDREKIRQWAINRISPEAGARYLIEIINQINKKGQKPIPPWHN